MTVFHPFVLDNAAGQETVVGIGSDSEKYGVGISSHNHITGIQTVDGFLHAGGGIKDTSGDMGSSGQVLSSTGTGLNWINTSDANVASASNVGTNDASSTNSTHYLAFLSATSGNNPVRVDTSLQYNPSINQLKFNDAGSLLIKQSDETDYNWTKGIQVGYDSGSPSPILMFAYNNNGYISDRGGELRITSDSSPIRIRTLNYGGDPELGSDIATFTPAGPVDLYYSGTKRFETTNTGAKVNGFLLKPNHPCCSVQERAAGVLDTNGESNYVTYVFDNILVNNVNHYDTSTGKFTCPVDGIYEISVSLLTRGSSIAHNVRVMKNSGGLTTFRSINGTGGSPEQNTGGRILATCSATDTLYIQVSNSSGGDFFNGFNNFSVNLVG